MTLLIKKAETLHELDAVFRLRHDVMVEEEAYLSPTPTGRIMDRFDGTPEATVLMAQVDGKLVGTVRVMERTSRGSSADDYFDFSPYLEGIDSVGAATHLVMRRAYRTIPNLTFSMIASAYAEAEKRGLTHLIGAANPLTISPFLQSGWQPLERTFYSKNHGLWVRPALLQLSDLHVRFRSFILEQPVGPSNTYAASAATLRTVA